MNITMKFFQLLVAICTLVTTSQQCLCTQLPHNPKSVVVSKDDVKLLGGWPIERRWYGTALQRLHEAGVKRVFLDIAFPSADILHPESDDFFFQHIEHIPETYLLCNDAQNDAEKYIVLGSKHLASDRFISPFSKGFSVTNNRIEFTKGTGTIVDYFLPLQFSFEKVLIDFPSSEVHPDYTLMQALQGQVICENSDVTIYVDYPGITSYIVGPNSQVVSTSSLQLWTIQQILSGNYRIFLPLWGFLLIIIIVLVPIAFGFIKSHASLLPGIISSTIWFGASVILMIEKIYLDTWWLLVLVPGIGFLSMQIIIKLRTKGFSRSVSNNIIPIIENDSKTDTMKELQHRLEYYERLSNQIPMGELREGFESNGMYCHKRSPFVEILRRAEQVAKNDIPVLIRGESGCGKEMLAQFIHQHSNRHGQPLIAVNCGALNDNLIEAELFGYEKGAFTGAFQQKPGRFELAHGGTLFLDEVSETSLAFQVKLLRVLQEGILERVGGTKSIPVSVRIITATHQDLTKAIHNKTFREDLFYRLNGYEFIIPPIRERQIDIEYLFKHFLFEIDQHLKYSDPLVEWLKAQSWPGNVRQLKASTQRAVINAQLRKRSFLIPKDFELVETKNDRVGTTEQLSEQILRKLRDCEFHHRSISGVATDLMIHRSTVTEYLRGWTIKFLNTGEWDHEFVITSLRGTAPISDEGQLRNRVREYILYVESRIIEGVRDLQTNEQILGTKFRNLPQAFRNDLIALIQKKRSLLESGKDAENL